MNIAHPIICAVAFALSLTACNSEIFVSHVRPDETSVSLAGDGGRVAVGFHPGGLRRISLENDYGTCGRYYDASGEEVSPQTDAKKIARISYETGWLLFNLEIDGGTLIFESVENASSDTCVLLLRLDYESVTECVEVSVLPGEPIRLVSVDYDDVVRVDDKARVSILSMDVDNQGSQPMTVSVTPYQGSQASVIVEPQDAWAAHRHVDMSLPEYSDGRWRLVGPSRIETGVKMNYTPSSVDRGLVVPVEIQPYSSVSVVTEVTYSSATVSGSLTFENPVSGRLSLSFFECRALEPVAYEVYVR